MSTSPEIESLQELLKKEEGHRKAADSAIFKKIEKLEDANANRDSVSMEIMTSLREIKTTLEGAMNNQGFFQKDAEWKLIHEAKIKQVERFQYVAVGGLIVLQIMIPVILGLLKK